MKVKPVAIHLLAESPTMEIVDTLEFLLGSWRVERRIEDHQTGISGSFSGVATFAQLEHSDASCLEKKVRFHETGELSFGAFSGHCKRSLEYLQLEGTKVQIFFANGRPFIDFDFSRGPSRNTHPCGRDLYEISFFVRSNDVLEETWRVLGPMKDYEATATLAREHSFSQGERRKG
jgi:hypothetical protein